MSRRIKKRFRKEDDCVPVFHGSTAERRPDQFDFKYAKESNDFGKAIYFGLTAKMARDWAILNGSGVVNWYIFKATNSYEDALVDVKILDDPLEWISTILMIYDSRYVGRSDIIIGDTMDARTGKVLGNYRRLADSLGILMSQFNDEIKLKMVSELNTEHFGQQIAFRTEQSLRHLEFIGSMGVDEMDDSWTIDPAEVAVSVANLLMAEDGMTRDEALVLFMKSDTFRRLMKNGQYTKMPPESLLELYRMEVRSHV